MAGLTYNSYVTQIALLAVVAEDDVNFQAAIPAMIDYAELRIYRDLDLMNSSTAFHDVTIKLTAGNRNLSIPMVLPDGSGFIVVTEQLNIITPAGQTDPDGGTSARVTLLPTTKEFLDTVYGSNLPAGRAQPKFFAPFNENLFFVGPVPDADYYVEVVGTFRPNSMSDTNQTTFISTYLPDLLLMASMIYISGYQRNFGRQSDDPQMAQSYESQYKALLTGAMGEEVRKKFESSGWSSQSPSPLASPSRG